MKKIAFMLLAVVCCVSFIDRSYAATLERGDAAYARSNLRANGSTIFWHNMKKYKTIIPAGTEVKMRSKSSFITVDANTAYTMIASPDKWDRYLVKDKKEIGLNGLSSDIKTKIENCEVTNGMTKEEVYASKGCPAFIAWGQKAKDASFNDIMQSDKWYYNFDARAHDVMVTFQNGIVVKTGGFER